MKAIFITGFMGAGKTTIGEELGEHLGYWVADTDHWIEYEQGQRIPHIFATEGEEAFRTYETKALRKASEQGGIITTGGGIVLKRENRRIMREQGTVVYLHCTADECYRRLAADTNRPLLEGKGPKEMAEMLTARMPYYRDADVIIDTTGQTVAAVVEEIDRQLTNNKQNRLY